MYETSSSFRFGEKLKKKVPRPSWGIQLLRLAIFTRLFCIAIMGCSISENKLDSLDLFYLTVLL